MSNKRPLKAYVRYDGSGRAVSSSLIWRKNKPKVGKWKEVQGYECCNPGGNGNQILCFTSSIASLSDFFSIYGKRTETIVPPYLSNFVGYTFTNSNFNIATTLEEWVEIANEMYSWMGMSFLINSENPFSVDICMKESVLKSIFPAEDGSTFNFYIGTP